MVKRYLCSGLTMLFFLVSMSPAPCAGADEKGIGMVTGSKTGTYFRFGKEIAEKAEAAGLNIIVKSSKGSISNIERLTSSENVSFAMVQSDVLGFLKRSDSPKMKKIAKKLRVIFPFHNEEIHVFANKSIKRFEDIQGKRLIMDIEGGGSWLSANNMLRITGVKPAEIIYLRPAEAVKAVLMEKAEAMIYVVGKPATLFTNLEEIQSKYPKLIEAVHFVPLDHSELLREYTPSEIIADDYSWFGSTIPTAALKAVLISYDFSSRHNAYYRKRCQQLATLGQVIRDNIGELRQSGHPKWKEVDLDGDTGIWKADTCSRTHTQPETRKKQPDSDISKELLKMLEKE